MLRVACGVVAVLLVGAVGFADDKKDEKAKLSGTWVREVEGFTVTWAFPKKDQMTVGVTAGDNGCTIKAEYEIDKDGVVKAKVTDVEEKGEFPAKPKKGFEFKFKFKIEKDKATLSDFEGENTEEAKKVVEGEYTKKKDSK